jgi:hypothetical protein
MEGGVRWCLPTRGGGSRPWERRKTTVIEAATPGVAVAARCEEGRRTDATLTEWTVGSVA